MKTAGSALFIDPNLFNDELYNGKKSDIYSCGILLYILLTGVPPFDGANDDEILETAKTTDIKYDDEQWQYISFEGKELCQIMLNKDPE